MRLDKSSLNRLPDLLDKVHDRYFWITQVVYDKNESKLALRLGEKKKGPFNRVLSISAVTGYVCEDIAGTGLNSIDILMIDLEKNIIIIKCNAPANIQLQVCSDFEIILKE